MIFALKHFKNSNVMVRSSEEKNSKTSTVWNSMGYAINIFWLHILINFIDIKDILGRLSCILVKLLYNDEK